jgi:PST family polysaccharide transporter
MSLAAKSARAAAWNLTTSAVVRGLGLVGTLVLTRFVLPQDYGEVAVAVLCAATAVRLLNLQVGNYVIAHRSPPPEAFQATILNAGTASLGVGVVLLAQEPLGRILGAPGMTRYLPWLAAATLIAQLSQVQTALLMRSMHFRAIAIIRSVGELVFTAVSVTLAPFLGAFALVVGNVSRAGLVTTAMMLRADRTAWLRPVRPRLETGRRFLAFGLPLSLGSLVDTTAWDKLLISRLFGPGVVGHYNLAYNLAQTPGTQVAEPILDVVLPSFSRIEPGRRPTALVRTLAIVAFLATPLALGLGAVAPTLVAVVLSQAWQDSSP